MNSTTRGLAGAFLLAAASVAAQGYPDRPVRVIVPVPAGGTPDVVARMVAPGLSAIFGQQLVIDNRGGAGGRIGTEMAARATPDGYTLMVGTPGPLAILPFLQRGVNYDALRDFAPISMIAAGPFLLLAHPSVPARSVKELIAHARSQPGRLNYASAGNGSTNHLAMELLRSMAEVNITHVPYKGAPQAVTDLIGGHANLMLNSIAPVLQHIRAERLRLLGVSSARRSPQLPDAPTIAESGVPGYEFLTWFGLLAPAGVPREVAARLSDAIVRVVRTSEVRAQFEAQGLDPVGGSPEDYREFLRREIDKYARAVRLSGAKVD